VNNMPSNSARSAFTIFYFRIIAVHNY
jgi:hypothetical protein